MPILKMENMTWKEITELNKDKSIIMVALSPIEEHGPHLPVGTDYISAIDLLETVVSHLEIQDNEYNYIIHPPFPVGYNECIMNYPGTISYKSKTIENLIIDFGESIIRSGIRKIVLVNHHLDLGHIKAIENAKEVLGKECEIKILEVASSIIYSEDADKYMKEIKEINMENEIHADVRETSFMLYKHPQLVKDCYNKLKPVYLNVEDFFKTGKKYWNEFGVNDGYIGAPAKSSEELGKIMFNDSVENISSIIIDFIKNDRMPKLSKNIKNAIKHMILR